MNKIKDFSNEEGLQGEIYTDVDYVVNLLGGLSIEELEELSKTISIMLDSKGDLNES